MKAPERNIFQTIAYYIGLYGVHLSNYGKRLVEYRADTFVAMFGGMAMQAGFLIFINTIYQRVPELEGYNRTELIFLFGFVTLGRELSRVFLDSPFRLSFIVRRGLLDTFIIRPSSTLFQLIALDVQVVASGGAIVGLVVMISSLNQMALNVGAGMIFWLVVAVLCNMLIQFAILMSLSTLSFKIPEVSSILLPVCWIYEFNRYPIGIFPAVIRGFLTFVLPFAVSAYYPVAYFLRPDLYPWVPVAVPCLTAALVGLSLAMWKWGMKHYSSSNA
ncbi:MAG: ABC-2 family transporter protein [Spirochaetales bacterium]|nr:ABC-2 family transporter protein [Spirochaetales bacterium]